MKTQLFVSLFFLIIASSCSTTSVRNELITAAYFDQIKEEQDQAKMGLFFSQMPKGGDIHHHYSGALYAETYLDWARERGHCISVKTLRIAECNTSDDSIITIDSLKENTELYRSVLETWSDIDYSNHYHSETQPDLHFFNTFTYFGEVSGYDYEEGLANIKNRAVNENVQYIETMLKVPPIDSDIPSDLNDTLAQIQLRADTTALNKILDSISNLIQQDSLYQSSIDDFLDSVYVYHDGLDDDYFKLRYQTYAVRTLDPVIVFTQLFSGFDATTKDESNLLVGVNIVAPENGIVSLRDYWLHMHMFRYLKSRFPGIHTAMHAGELAVGMVPPENLNNHIHDAVFIAGANRIGHGVDIPFELNAIETLEKMRSDSIAIEINLTSNEFILGVYGNAHPINIYYEAGVPIIISTDDAGVSRNTIVTEYVKLASRYDFSYDQIKSFCFNSIRYSFMEPTDKKLIIRALTHRFKEFESNIAGMNGG